MLHTQAFVETDRASRYASRLAEQLAGEFETEWSAEAGFVRIPEGICAMHTWPEGLRLDAYADTAENLGLLELEIRRRLESSVDAGDRLAVDWHRRS